VPVATQTIAGHRMYLPHAPLVALAVLGLFQLPVRRTFLVGSALALALGAATALRNQDDQAALGLWADTVAKHPSNARAHDNLGILLHGAGRVPEAITHFETARRLRPNFPEARSNLGAALLGLGRPAEASPTSKPPGASTPPLPPRAEISRPCRPGWPRPARLKPSASTFR